MHKGTCHTPKPARSPLQGTCATAYEAPPRTSGAPRRTTSAGTAKMVNVSETKPGMGTGGDGQKVRRVK